MDSGPEAHEQQWTDNFKTTHLIMRGKGACGSKPTCDDDAYLAEMKQKTAALKKDQDARMKKEIKGVKVEMERSKKLNEIVNPMH